MNLNAEFGKKIKYFREQFGYTQEELAEKLSIHAGNITKIENGAQFVSIKTLQEIVGAFSISYKELFDFSEKNPAEEKKIQELTELAQRLNENDLDFFIGVIKDYIKTRPV